LSKHKTNYFDKKEIEANRELLLQKLSEYTKSNKTDSKTTEYEATFENEIQNKEYSSDSKSTSSLSTGEITDTYSLTGDFSKDVENSALKTQLWTHDQLNKLKEHFDKSLGTVKDEISTLRINFTKIDTKVKIFIMLFIASITIFIAGFSTLNNKLNSTKPSEIKKSESIISKDSTNKIQSEKK